MEAELFYIYINLLQEIVEEEGLYEINQFSFKMGAFYVRRLLREKNGKHL